MIREFEIRRFYQNPVYPFAGIKNPQGKAVRLMPELPEIETIKSVIEPQIQGLTIESVLINRPEVIAHPAAEEFCRLAAGRIISSMSRRGKFLIFHLDSGDRILIHLRMTGCLLVMPPDVPPEKHTHITMRLTDGMELRFSDTRRFGRFLADTEG